MPRYSASDYDLWSKYDRSEYTSFSFDDHYNLSSCTHQGMVLISPTRATMSSSCDVTATGHLYVKYVYYYGFFSDYWWYWNFYDTKTFTSSALTTVTVNPGGSGFKVRSVAIN